LELWKNSRIVQRPQGRVTSRVEKKHYEKKKTPTAYKGSKKGRNYKGRGGRDGRDQLAKKNWDICNKISKGTRK